MGKGPYYRKFDLQRCHVVFAPREAFPGKKTSQSEMYELIVKGIELFTHSDTATVKVLVIINGKDFNYQSIADVEWLEVSFSMAGQHFRLPSANRYEVRFEMIKREPNDNNIVHLRSVETISFVQGSTEGRYGLYGFDPASRTRSGQIGAQVIYSIQPVDR